MDFGLASWAVDGRRCFLWEVFVKCDDGKMMSLLSGWGGEADFSTPLRFGRNDDAVAFRKEGQATTPVAILFLQGRFRIGKP